ncbi:MAG: TRAP transporter substrate-binding protein DctP [Deltaproteobacteria bacterium]|nr:TRAP transporter substrate-binding protein DctP [Deltaproteobacteria bacterium]
MKKEILVLTIAAVCLAFSALGIMAPPVHAEKAIELSETHHFPPASMEDQIIQTWLKKGEELSNGKIKFKSYAGGVLVSAFETYNSISKGVADIGVGFRYGVGCPFTDEIFSMALMGTPSVAVSTKVVDDLMVKYADWYKKEWGDTRILYNIADPAVYLSTRDTPVRVPSDMKGIDIRASIKPQVELVKAGGGSPVNMPLSDFVLGLQKGVVKGGLIGGVSLRTFKVVPPLKYHTDFAVLACPTSFAVINIQKYDSLSPDLKKAIDDMGAFGKEETVRVNDEQVSEALKWCMDRGMENIIPTPEERNTWVQFLTDVYLKLAADMDAKGYPATEAFKYTQERLNYHMGAK